MDATYREINDALLAAIADAPAAIPLCFFRSHVGHTFDGRLMIIGRAVNGWDKPFLPVEMKHSEARQRLLNRVDVEAATSPCMMRWVSDLWPRTGKQYSTSRSAFWRVAKKTAAMVGITGPDWPSYLAWTNLYRVSPRAGGNPGRPLASVQLPHAIRLLALDIEQLQPRLALVMTGWDWIEPFAGALGARFERRKGLVEAVAMLGNTRLVVVPHPQGKPESRIIEAVAEVA